MSNYAVSFPNTIHISNNSDAVTLIDSGLPLTKYKKSYTQPKYNHESMTGNHPLSIETHDYVLMVVHTSQIDQSTFISRSAGVVTPTLDGAEMLYVNSVRRKPEVEWAVNNSFDGMYITTESDPATFTMRFRFAVYMKSEHATFWRLKFNE